MAERFSLKDAFRLTSVYPLLIGGICALISPFLQWFTVDFKYDESVAYSFKFAGTVIPETATLVEGMALLAFVMAIVLSFIPLYIDLGKWKDVRALSCIVTAILLALASGYGYSAIDAWASTYSPAYGGPELSYEISIGAGFAVAIIGAVLILVGGFLAFSEVRIPPPPPRYVPPAPVPTLPPRIPHVAPPEEAVPARPRFCPKCGRELPEGVAFCPYCGHKLTE